MAQSVEHVIGNDEVISSILITSSKKAKRISVLPFLYQSRKRLHIITRKRVSHQSRKRLHIITTKSCIHALPIKFDKNPPSPLDKFLY